MVVACSISKSKQQHLWISKILSIIKPSIVMNQPISRILLLILSGFFFTVNLQLATAINHSGPDSADATVLISGYESITASQTIQELPESEPARCNFPSGFYDDPFTAVVSGFFPGDSVIFTLDGTDPRSSTNTLRGVSPVTVLIDPESTLGGRGKTGGVVLRASAFRPGFQPSQPFSHTYIFLDQVIAQRHPGGSWPSSSINRQVFNFVMDARVTSDSRYKDLMRDALLDIPSLSVTTDPASLFDRESGIYVNANKRGREWERPANIELINPDGSPGFNIDAGIRIRGGWSRHPEFAKHAFRLFFRSEYGESKLNFPLFGSEGVHEFDKVDLRTSQNYSWSKGGSEGRHNTMNRDVFSRDTQRDIGQPYTRSRYYHLYVNGLYWGIYQTQERAEARFAESYFGGNRDDYDVIKVDIGENWDLYDIEATDGNTDAWREIWNMCVQGFSSNENYFRLLGLNAAGEADTSLNVWVDIDNLIDYMLIIFFGGNFDAPLSKFRGNRDPNNFYAIYNRNDKRDGFKFFIHDAEHSLLTDAVGPGTGLHENRVNIGIISSNRMNVSRFEKFHPQWLHHRLTENAEYRISFADRVYRHFFIDKVFDPDTCVSRFRKTSDQLDLAIIAESAKWGNMGVSVPRTKHNDWLPAVNRVVNNYFPYRTDIVIKQLTDENLYPGLQPPIALYEGEAIEGNTMSIAEKITILLRKPGSEGSVFYTIDGTDPRAVGGGRSATAIVAGNQKYIEVQPGSQVKARLYDGTSWSALREIAFSISGQLTAYWHFDSNLPNNQPLETIEPTFSLNEGTLIRYASSLEGYPFDNNHALWRIASLERRNAPTPLNYRPEGNDNQPYDASLMRGIQVKQPFFADGKENTLFVHLPATGFSNLVLRFAAMDEDAANAFLIDYSTREGDPEWVTGGLDIVEYPLAKTFQLVEIDFSKAENVNNNPNFIIRIRFKGDDMTTDSGNRVTFNNFSLDAVPGQGMNLPPLIVNAIDLQPMIEQQDPITIDLNTVFYDPDGDEMTFSVDNNLPGHVETTLDADMIMIRPIKRGDALIRVAASDGFNDPVHTSFRVLVYPSAHIFEQGDYTFDHWSAAEPDYSYPEHMIFLQTDANDPGINHPLLHPYFVPHDDYHANDQDNIGFPYASSGRTRINALGDNGLSFINTGRGRDLGGALLALDTRHTGKLHLAWTAGTILRNQRTYALRLQYRTGIGEEFKDLVADGQIQEYLAMTDGHVHTFDAISLPSGLMGQEYLQLLWRYYHVAGTSGPRSELRLDDIHVGTTVNIPEKHPANIRVFATGNMIHVNLEDNTPAVMSVYNPMGQQLLGTTIEQPGLHGIPARLPAGIYFIRIESKSGSYSRKILITDP